MYIYAELGIEIEWLFPDEKDTSKLHLKAEARVSLNDSETSFSIDDMFLLCMDGSAGEQQILLNIIAIKMTQMSH